MRIHFAILASLLALTGCPSSNSNAGGGATQHDSGTKPAADGGGGVVDGGGAHGAMDAGSADAGSTGNGGMCVTMFSGMVAACIEYLSAADYSGAKGVCTSHGGTWGTACPAGKTGGCKVPPGATGGAPGGTIRWSYAANITCGAGETLLKPDGIAGDAGMPVTDAGPAIAVGPGGPVSAACKTELMTVAPFGSIYPSCMADTVCASCVTTDYAASACQMDKIFKSMLAFACLTPGPASYPSCTMECGK